MTSSIDLVSRRLRSQKLAASGLRTPAAVVAWLGAVQAQDYTAATWALGLRARGVTQHDVERAFAEGAILRTHVLRPTWHFVRPEDIRWMLALIAPRVQKLAAGNYRKLELDSGVFASSRKVLARALRGGRYLTRTELGAALLKAGVPWDRLRLAHLMFQAELEALICSGPRRGKQFTYALLEERVPAAPAMAREDAVAALVLRYFTSHGPASVRDFVWWSGLAVRDATDGIAMLGSALRQEEIDGRVHYAPASRAGAVPPAAYLLPNYDEFSVAYKDRLLLPAAQRPPGANAFLELGSIVLLGDRFVGRWRASVKGDRTRVEVEPLARLKPADWAAIETAAETYGRFLDRPVTLTRA